MSSEPYGIYYTKIQTVLEESVSEEGSLIEPPIVTEEEIERIAYNATEYAITIIKERYNIDDALSNISWISQVIMDNITEYVVDFLNTSYNLSSVSEEERDNIIEQICGMIDWDYIYDTLEEYSHQPRTMSDMLRDVGMCEKDFL